MLKRVFIASFIKDTDQVFLQKIVHKIEKYLDLLHIKSFSSKPKNLHATVAFLGHIQEESVISVKHILKDFKSEYIAVDLKLMFGFGLHPNVIYIYFKSHEFITVSNKIRKRLKVKNLFIPEHSFVPHITLIRIKQNLDISKVKAIENRFKNINVKDFSLNLLPIDIYKSELTKKGPIYTKVK